MANDDREIPLDRVGHDLRNHLAVISAYADLVLSAMRSSDPNRADVEEIRHAVDRALELSRLIRTATAQLPEEPPPSEAAVLIACK